MTSPKQAEMPEAKRHAHWMNCELETVDSWLGHLMGLCSIVEARIENKVPEENWPIQLYQFLWSAERIGFILHREEIAIACIVAKIRGGQKKPEYESEIVRIFGRETEK